MEDKFIGTCMKGYEQQLLLHIPKSIVQDLKLERRDKVEITIRKIGIKNTRTIPPLPWRRT
jgi:hypothetical protein